MQNMGLQVRLVGLHLGKAADSRVRRDPHDGASAEHRAFEVDDLHSGNPTYGLIMMPCGPFMIQEPASLGTRWGVPIFISSKPRMPAAAQLSRSPRLLQVAVLDPQYEERHLRVVRDRSRSPAPCRIFWCEPTYNRAMQPTSQHPNRTTRVRPVSATPTAIRTGVGKWPRAERQLWRRPSCRADISHCADCGSYRTQSSYSSVHSVSLKAAIQSSDASGCELTGFFIVNLLFNEPGKGARLRTRLSSRRKHCPQPNRRQRPILERRYRLTGFKFRRE